MFIKLIEIYGEFRNHRKYYHLREVVINKKNIITMMENVSIRHNVAAEDSILPEGLDSSNQQYTDIYLSTNITREVVCTVVGSLDHIYKLLETDSMLNHRQTLRG